MSSDPGTAVLRTLHFKLATSPANTHTQLSKNTNMNNHASNNVGNDFLGWRLTKTNFVFIVLDFNLRGKREILPEGDPSMFNKKTTQKQLAFAWAVDVVRANTCVAMANRRIANRRICVAKAKIGRAFSCF